MDLEVYYEKTTTLQWGHLQAAHSFIDGFLKLTKEESLSPSLSLAPFTSTVGAIQDFYATKIASMMWVPKLSSRHGLVLSRLGVLAVARTCSFERSMAIHRGRAERLLKYIDSVISKLDGLSASDSGEAYIPPEIELSKKLEAKF